MQIIKSSNTQTQNPAIHKQKKNPCIISTIHVHITRHPKLTCKTGICFEALEDEYVCEEDWEALVWLFEGGGDDLGEVFPSVTLFTSTRGSGTVLNIW